MWCSYVEYEDESTKVTSTDKELAVKEKQAAKRIDIAPVLPHLGVALAAYLIGLAGPIITKVRMALAVIQETGGADLKITEWVYLYTSFLGTGLCLILLLATRRMGFAIAAWVFSGIALFSSLLALWLRQTDKGDATSGWGMYLSIFGVILAVYALSNIIMRRSDQQKKLAEERASLEITDAVGLAQRDLLAQQKRDWDTNPLFVDDRRQQAAERHHSTPQAPKPQANEAKPNEAKPNEATPNGSPNPKPATPPENPSAD